MSSQKWPGRRSQRIDFVFDEEIKKGVLNENLEEEALQSLREKGHIFHYFRAEKGGDLDSIGIDFLIWLKTGRILALQVKSSERGRQEHLFEYGYLVPHCIVVEPSDSVLDLVEKTLAELGLDIRPLEEVLEEIIREARNGSIEAATGSL